MAGVAQSHIHDAARLCVAGVAFGDIHLDFTWHCFRLRLVCSTGLLSMLCSSMLDGRSGMFYFRTCFLLFPTCFLSTSLVYACPVYGRSGMLFLLLISRGTVFVFASFVLLACSVCYVPACWMVAPACCFYHFLHVYLPACFFFPRVSACLILACLSTFFFRPAAFLAHTHTHLWPGAGLARDRQSPTALHVFFFACLRMSCLWSLWHVVSTYIFSACLPFSACLSSGMFLLSACFGMFDFGMFKYFLL